MHHILLATDTTGVNDMMPTEAGAGEGAAVGFLPKGNLGVAGRDIFNQKGHISVEDWRESGQEAGDLMGALLLLQVSEGQTRG